MKVVAYNKILHDTLPIEKVCSPDEIRWVTSKVRHEGSYETDTHLFKRAEAS